MLLKYFSSMLAYSNIPFITAWAVIDPGVTNTWTEVNKGVSNTWTEVDKAA